MESTEEYRFKINAYNPATIPMVRLAEYLLELAKMLGEEQHVHFSHLEEGSTISVQKIDYEAIERIEIRTNSIRIGEAPNEAMEAYKKVNKMLREDNTTAVLLKGTQTTAEIIQFPGIKALQTKSILIRQMADIEGKVVSIGGMGKRVPVHLEVEGIKITGCTAARDIAKELSSKLFEPVRLFGEGYWSRSEDGIWALAKFNVDRFEPLNDESLSESILALRNLSGDSWGRDAINNILHFRHNGEY